MANDRTEWASMMFLGVDESGAVVGGVLTAVAGFALLFLAIVWALFPFLVNSKINHLIRELQAARKEAAAAAKETNFYLKAISDRTHLDATLRQTERAVPEEKANVDRASPETTRGAEEVYRID